MKFGDLFIKAKVLGWGYETKFLEKMKPECLIFLDFWEEEEVWYFLTKINSDQLKKVGFMDARTADFVKI